jgi:hypothetical protein
MKSLSLLAQNLNVGGQNVKGPLKGIDNLGDLINVLMKFVIPFGAIILFFVILWGGYDYMTSGGSDDKIQTAKMKITAGIIGFVLLTVSYVLVGLISGFFGLGGGIF